MFCFKRNNMDSSILQYMCRHLEAIMRNPHPDCNYRSSTLDDWNRNQASDWGVNGDLFKANTDLPGLERWIKQKIPHDWLSLLVLNFANQSCWYEPATMVKRAYLMQDVMIGDDLNTSTAQDMLLAASPNASAQQAKDSLEIKTHTGGKRLQVNLIKNFPKCSIGYSGLNLERPIELSITFIVSVESGVIVVSNVNLNMNPPAENLGLPPLVPTLLNYIRENPIPGQPVSRGFRWNCFKRRTSVAPAPFPARSGNANLNNGDGDSQI